MSVIRTRFGLKPREGVTVGELLPTLKVKGWLAQFGWRIVSSEPAPPNAGVFVVYVPEDKFDEAAAAAKVLQNIIDPFGKQPVKLILEKSEKVA